jgi:hypothetical protein
VADELETFRVLLVGAIATAVSSVSETRPIWRMFCHMHVPDSVRGSQHQRCRHDRINTFRRRNHDKVVGIARAEFERMSYSVRCIIWMSTNSAAG